MSLSLPVCQSVCQSVHLSINQSLHQSVSISLPRDMFWATHCSIYSPPPSYTKSENHDNRSVCRTNSCIDDCRQHTKDSTYIWFGTQAFRFKTENERIKIFIGCNNILIEIVCLHINIARCETALRSPKDTIGHNRSERLTGLP